MNVNHHSQVINIFVYIKGTNIQTQSSGAQICKFETTTKDYLKRHNDIQHLGIKYDCSECTHRAASRSGLAVHKKLIHMKINLPKLKCEQCEFETHTKTTLKIHIDSIHSGIKYDCTLCDYKGSQKGQVRTHMEMVHFKKKYPCNICSLEFASKQNVQKHLRKQHRKC